MAVEFSADPVAIPLEAPRLSLSRMNKPTRRQLLGLFMVPFVNPFPVPSLRDFGEQIDLASLRIWSHTISHEVCEMVVNRSLVPQGLTIMAWLDPPPPLPEPIGVHVLSRELADPVDLIIENIKPMTTRRLIPCVHDQDPEYCKRCLQDG